MTEARVAAIDVGTNTVRLLVADVDADALRDVDRDLVITRLGEGVDASTRLLPEAIARTTSAIKAFVDRARQAGASSILVAGTSAVRDAVNRDDLVDAVRDATGIELRVLAGDDEARLAFRGAAAGVDLSGGGVVCDIGGGSTELVAGDTDVRAAISVDVGSVRLTERHIEHDPPEAHELAGIRNEARAAMRTAAVHIDPVLFGMPSPILVGVAGTVTTLAAFLLALTEYDRDAVHGAHLSATQIAEGGTALASMTLAERRALPIMPPGREDVIVAGVILLEEILDLLGFRGLVVSESDILDGLALAVFDLR